MGPGNGNGRGPGMGGLALNSQTAPGNTSGKKVVPAPPPSLQLVKPTNPQKALMDAIKNKGKAPAKMPKEKLEKYAKMKKWDYQMGLYVTK